MSIVGTDPFAVVEINPDDTPLTARAGFRLQGPAGVMLPALLAALGPAPG